MTDDMSTHINTHTNTHIKHSRLRVSRSRGALGGGLLIVFGAWAALIPFIGPYFDFATAPQPNDAFHWTAARGWLEVLPGAAAVVGGILLLVSANRLVTSVGGWIAAAGGAWLVVGPALSGPLGLTLGGPDPTAGQNKQAAIVLLFFYGIGAAIVLVAGLALGRLSVHSVRDVRAAEHRAAQEAERQEAERRAVQERVAQEQAAQEQAAQEQAAADQASPGEQYPGQHYLSQPYPGQHVPVHPDPEVPPGQHVPVHPDPEVPQGHPYAAPDGDSHLAPEGERPVPPPPVQP